jgi:hypothetical protein
MIREEEVSVSRLLIIETFDFDLQLPQLRNHAFPPYSSTGG